MKMWQHRLQSHLPNHHHHLFWVSPECSYSSCSPRLKPTLLHPHAFCFLSHIYTSAARLKPEQATPIRVEITPSCFYTDTSLQTESSQKTQVRPPNLSCKENYKSAPVINLAFRKTLFQIPSRFAWNRGDSSAPAQRLEHGGCLSQVDENQTGYRAAQDGPRYAKRELELHERWEKWWRVGTRLQIWLTFLSPLIVTQRDFSLWKQHG